jgi:hypothetical protein
VGEEAAKAEVMNCRKTLLIASMWKYWVIFRNCGRAQFSRAPKALKQIKADQ